MEFFITNNLLLSFLLQDIRVLNYDVDQHVSDVSFQLLVHFLLVLQLLLQEEHLLPLCRLIQILQNEIKMNF